MTTELDNTVDGVLKRMAAYVTNVHQTAFNNATESSLRTRLHNMAVVAGDWETAIRDAHRREIADLRACLLQAYGDKIGTYTMRGNEVAQWKRTLDETGGVG